MKGDLNLNRKGKKILKGRSKLTDEIMVVMENLHKIRSYELEQVMRRYVGPGQLFFSLWCRKKL